MANLRRMLMVASGGAVFAPPSVFALTSAPNGGWTTPAQPHAYYYNGKTYFGWIDGTTGATEVASYDHATKTTSAITQIADLGGPDNHDSPSIMVRESDKKVIVAYAEHIDSVPRYKISSSAEDISAFGSEQTLTGIGVAGIVTYISQVQLRGVTNDPIYFFWREVTGSGPSETSRWCYSISTDDGATWGTRVIVYTGAANTTPYMAIGTDWDTRIDLFVTDDYPSTGVWHMYIDGSAGTYHKSDGTAITGPPFDTTDLTAVDTGFIAMFGTSWNGSSPALVYLRDTGSSDNSVRTARWRSAWQVDTVLASVGGQVTGNVFASGCTYHRTDHDTVYIARKLSGIFEMYRYTSTNDGVTWNGTALTASSTDDNIWPEFPAFMQPGFRLMWLYGDYTNDNVFNFGLRALS